MKRMILTMPGLDLGKIAESGQCFRWQPLSDGGYRIPHGAHCLYIREAAPYRFELDCTEAEFESVWKPYFDLDTDYEAIDGVVEPASDPYLHEAMRGQRGVRILRQDAWEMIVTAIITQNRNIPAIQRSVELLSMHGGTPGTDRRGRPFYRFPTPEQLVAMDDDALSLCRLGYREKYVRRAAEATCAGTLDPGALRGMTDDECRARLVSQYGIGEKVAACIMLFGLHRLNAFPRDVWMNRVLSEHYPDGYPFERYAPYNGVYQQYLFAHYRGTHSHSTGEREK